MFAYVTRHIASAFAYIDRILNAVDQDLMATQALSVLEYTFQILKRAGFAENDFEEQRRVLLSVIHAIAYPDGDDGLSTASLVQLFNDDQSKC